MTNFSSLRPGDTVNLEVDIIAKYVERILSFGAHETAPLLTAERLAELGYK
jgi:riboflavin synthase alpha subunit